MESITAWARRACQTLAALALLVPAILAARPAAAEAVPDCHAVSIPVALHAGLPRNYQIAGQMCTPPGQHPSAVQLLLHGATYTRAYWDWPSDPDTYSYVRRAVDAGYAALAVDRIGHGQSSIPLSALVDTSANAYTTHEVIQALRDGQVGTYPKVISVGHSYGSITALQEASTFNDVDATILTGVAHRFSPTGMAQIVSSFFPSDLGHPGYLTTLPGTRGPDFYNTDPAYTDPAVLAYDEAHKDTVSESELATFAATLLIPPARIPTLVVLGSEDAIFCGGLLGTDCSSSASVKASESLAFPPGCLATYVLPGAGHDINLQRNAADWYTAAQTWTSTHVGSGSGPAAHC